MTSTVVDSSSNDPLQDGLTLIDPSSYTDQEDTTDNEQEIDINNIIGEFEFDDVFEYRQIDEDTILHQESKNFNNQVQSNPYIKEILNTSGLYVHKQETVLKMWRKNGPLGLFHMFLQKSFLNTVREWTNEKLKKEPTREQSHPITPGEFYNYMGLELGTSLLHMNDFKNYWQSGLFSSTSSSFYPAVMRYTRFSVIRGIIRFTPPDTSEDADKIHANPLWHSEPLLKHFYLQCANVAVPLGPGALDENGAATKARTKASSYMPSKPDKYAIRFYSLVGHRYLYLFSMFDNNRGNSTGLNLVDRYAFIHRELRHVVASKFKDKCNTKPGDINRESASALWTTQLGHMCMKKPMSDVNIRDKSRRIFTDNFYTRHALGQKMKEISNNELKLCGTVRLNFVDEVNKVNVIEGIEMMKKAERGDWVLVPAFNFEQNHEKEKNAFLKEQKKKKTRRKYEPKMGDQVDNAGFILFMDSKLCIFYSNDLASTPSQQNVCSRHSDEDAIKHAWKCMHGKAPLRRYPPAKDGVKGDIGRIVYQVPAVIVAYNYFMCLVDLLDQRRANLATKRKERRVHMSIWTMILDLACHQGYSLYEWLRDNHPDVAEIVMKEKITKKLTFRDFKMKIVESLVEDRLKNNDLITKKPKTSEEDHVLFSLSATNEDTCKMVNPQLKCELCDMMSGKRKFAQFYCGTCKVGFHPQCFHVYHNRHQYPDLKDNIDAADEDWKRKKRRVSVGSKYFNESISLPYMK